MKGKACIKKALRHVETPPRTADPCAGKPIDQEDPVVTKQLQNFARQTVFDTLSALFIRPEGEDTLQRYKEMLPAAAALAAELGTDSKPFERALVTPKPKAVELEREYAKLFLGVGTETVPLSESAWTSPQQILCQEAQLECRKAYLDAGLETAGLLGVPEDHLGMELGFMAVLILKEDTEGAARFFAAHPAKWLPGFAEALRLRGDAVFFREVADILDAVCEMEKLIADQAA